MNCLTSSVEIPRYFTSVSDAAVRQAVSDGDYSGIPDIPGDAVDHLVECVDCSNDLLWFIGIRQEIDVTTYPCLHLAFACSSRGNGVIERQHGMFAIRVDVKTGRSIVIGFCPWCGLRLNTAAEIPPRGMAAG